MVSTTLDAQKRRLETLVSAKPLLVKPEFVTALALLEILEVLEKIEAQIPADGS